MLGLILPGYSRRSLNLNLRQEVLSTRYDRVQVGMTQELGLPDQGTLMQVGIMPG
jgi:hypothetical protein